MSVALDLDFSESITSVLNDIKESAKGFIRNLTTPGDEASVIKFAREVVVEAIGFDVVQVDPVIPDPAITCCFSMMPLIMRIRTRQTPQSFSTLFLTP